DTVPDTVRRFEINVEQRCVTRVYARLADLGRRVAGVEKAGYGLARVGNFGAYVERDAMVYHAARRRHALDAEYEGLVFGRLDLRPEHGRAEHGRAEHGRAVEPSPADPAVPGGEVRYIGRLGLRDEAHESLLVDWRAPPPAALFPAPPPHPVGGRRPPPPPTPRPHPPPPRAPPPPPP